MRAVLKVRSATDVIVKGLALLVVGAMLIVMPLAARAIYLEDDEPTGPWSELYWKVELLDLGGGTYLGRAVGSVDSSTESSFYIMKMHNHLVEYCNGLLETDYEGGSDYYNSSVPHGYIIAGSGGYGTGWSSCFFGQALWQEGTDADPNVQLYDTSPVAVDVRGYDPNLLCIPKKGTVPSGC